MLETNKNNTFIRYEDLNIAVKNKDALAMRRFVVEFENDVHDMWMKRDKNLMGCLRIANQKKERLIRTTTDMSAEFAYCFGMLESIITSYSTLIKDREFEEVLFEVISKNEKIEKIIDTLFLNGTMRHIDLATCLNIKKEELTQLMITILKYGIASYSGLGETTRYTLAPNTKRCWIHKEGIYHG